STNLLAFFSAWASAVPISATRRPEPSVGTMLGSFGPPAQNLVDRPCCPSCGAPWIHAFSVQRRCDGVVALLPCIAHLSHPSKCALLFGPFGMRAILVDSVDVASLFCGTELAEFHP